MITLFVLINAVVAAISAVIGSRKSGPAILALILSGFVSLLTILWGYPAIGFNYADFWMFVCFSVIIGSTSAGIMNSILGVQYSRQKPIPKPIPTIWVIAPPVFFCLSFALLASLTSSEVIHASAYHSLLKVEERSFSEVQMAEVSHIRLVPKQTALAKASKVLGQSTAGDVLGSQLSIDHQSAAIQQVQGELWWIIPLDFEDFFKWNNRGVIPGYIKVSAQDPNRPAELVTKDASGQSLAIRYTPGAYFGKLLTRNAFLKHPSVAREDLNFEVDESWRPYYVYSASEPKVGFGGLTTIGVITTDAQTGEVKMHTSDIPSWIDRVRPEGQAVEQVDYWGHYGEGWLNSVMSRKNMKEVTGYNMWFVRLNGHNYWFSGMTSISSKDDSLVGMIFVSTHDVTAPAIYFPMQGANEDGIENAVESGLGAEKTSWTSSSPIPYNIFGVPTAVVPVISRSTNLYQKVALVNINEISVMVIEENLATALKKYRNLLGRNNGTVAVSEQEVVTSFGPAKVLRLGDTVIGGEKTRYLILEGMPNLWFSSNGNNVNTLPIIMVKEGDVVTVKYNSGVEGVAPIQSLNIAGVKFDDAQP